MSGDRELPARCRSGSAQVTRFAPWERRRVVRPARRRPSDESLIGTWNVMGAEPSVVAIVSRPIHEQRLLARH